MESRSIDGTAADQPPPEAAPAQAPKRPWPLVTLVLCALCALLFVGIQAKGAPQSWDSVARWGYLPANLVWDGAYWALVSSAFVHLALWHLAFNVYWLWVLGAAVERTLGARSYLGFVLASAFVSSAVQLGVSGNTGHGASGVVYALFGLMWASRRRVPELARALGDKTSAIFWVWLVGCVLATRAGVADVGNGAHVGGLVLGLVTAPWLVLKTPRRRLALAATGLLAALSLVPLFWCPWSSTWVAYRGHKAHLAGDYAAAIGMYRRSIALGGNRLWALENTALAYHSSGAEKEYAATLAEIRTLDANAATALETMVREAPDDGTTTP